jgi:hypothetical protein
MPEFHKHIMICDSCKEQWLGMIRDDCEYAECISCHKITGIRKPLDVEIKLLPLAKTVGELQDQLNTLPKEMDFGWLNQTPQQLQIREYKDGYKCVVFT